MATKKCPFCAEEIQEEAFVCQHCGQSLTSREWEDFLQRYDKMTEAQRKKSREKLTDEQRKMLDKMDSAQGIRDAMTASYQKHLRLISEKEKEEQYLPPRTTPHHAALSALYSASGTLYMTFADGPSPEVVFELEMYPFMHLEPELSITALAEYVVYRVLPEEADHSVLVPRLKEGLGMLSESERQVLERNMKGYRFAWGVLLDEVSAFEVFEDRPVWRELPQSFLEALAKKFKSAETAGNFALLCEKTGMLENNICKLQFDPKFALFTVAQILNSYASTMGEEGKPMKAKTGLEFALLLEPNNVASWLMMAIVSKDLGDFKTAVTWADKCLNFEPDPNSESDWERGLASQPQVVEGLKKQARAVKALCN